MGGVVEALQSRSGGGRARGVVGGVSRQGKCSRGSGVRPGNSYEGLAAFTRCTIQIAAVEYDTKVSGRVFS